MEKINAAHKVRCYISENQISVTDISESTSVEKSKLIHTSEADFNATEFLAICDFLKVDPRIFA